MIKPAQCPLCEEFVQGPARHLWEMHNMYTCPCGKEFRTHYDLAGHLHGVGNSICECAGCLMTIHEKAGVQAGLQACFDHVVENLLCSSEGRS